MTVCYPLPQTVNHQQMNKMMKKLPLLLTAVLLLSSCQQQDWAEFSRMFEQGVPAKPFNPHRVVN